MVELYHLNTGRFEIEYKTPQSVYNKGDFITVWKGHEVWFEGYVIHSSEYRLVLESWIGDYLETLQTRP